MSRSARANDSQEGKRNRNWVGHLDPSGGTYSADLPHGTCTALAMGHENSGATVGTMSVGRRRCAFRE